MPIIIGSVFSYRLFFNKFLQHTGSAMGRALLLAVAALLVGAASARPSDSASAAAAAEDAGAAEGVAPAALDDYRLNPDTLSIYDYDIVIKPDFYGERDVHTFSGEVKITGYFNANMKRITLHAGNNLRIVSARINYSSGNVIKVLSTQRDAQREFLHLDYDGNLFSGFYITITYTGTFSGNTEGFYKTFYKVEEEERMLLVTQFEPTMARRAFPCFDEPGWKAKFRLTIYAPQGYGALSNTPLDKVSSDWGTTETTKYVFQSTVKMPTYSLAFMLYEEDSYGRTPFGVVTQSDVSIFTWGPKSDIDAGRADHSQTAAAKVLDALEKYLAWPYRDDNITKVDQAVVPNLRLQGRENWGLISYSADRLFMDKEESTPADLERVESEIANELAHQWFGNLVTPGWWDDVWLSEGLDAYQQYWALAQLHPDWRLPERLVVEQQQRAMLEDGRADARSLTDPVSTPAQVDAKFNDLTSAKGASVIRLLSNIIGEGNLQEALRSYVSIKNHQSVSTSDFGAILVKHTPGNITYNLNQILSSWTNNPGYPLVTVSRDYTGGTAQAKQERFFYNQNSGTNFEYYLLVTLLQNSPSSSFMIPDANPIAFQSLDANRWVLLTNTGYYRVNYDEQNWALLLDAVKGDRDQIPALDRAQLVDDSLNLARAGVRTYENALTFVEYLTVERDYMPWAAAFPGLRFLERMLVNVDGRGSLKKFTLNILTTVYAYLGFSNFGTHLDKLLRTQILRSACSAGDADCLANSQAILRGYLDGDKPLEADLRSVVLCYGLQQGMPADWTKVYTILATSDIDSERADIIAALGCSKDEIILHGYLEIILKDPYLRDHERPKAFAAVFANPIGVDLALDILVRDFNILLSEFGEKPLAKIVKDLAEYLVTNEQAQKMRSLAVQYPEMSDVLNEAYIVADDNAFWVSSNGEAVVRALEAVTPVSTTSTHPTQSTIETSEAENTGSTTSTHHSQITTETSQTESAGSTTSTQQTQGTTEGNEGNSETSTLQTQVTTETSEEDGTDSTVTQSTTILPESPKPSSGKSYVGLIIFILVFFGIWVAGSVLLFKRQKKII